MKKRILTTHVGSLPRSKKLTELIFAKERVNISQSDERFETTFNKEDFSAALEEAVFDVFKKQKEIGIDIPSDGEMSKVSYATYIKERLSGFAGDSPRRVPADLLDFKKYAEKIGRSGGTPEYRRPKCVDELKVMNLEPLFDDIAREKRAMEKFGYKRAFMNAASPGVIALFQPSDFHTSHDAYLENLAEAMRQEYEAIVKAGLHLQIDAPDLALGRHMLVPDFSDAQFLKLAEKHIEVLNHALRNIPADMIRMHVCWGNYEGPHHRDIEMKRIASVILKAKVGYLLFEAANPRHAHEWEVWKNIAIPENYFLCPGLIDSTSNFIEHPDLVAERIRTYVNIVGANRVIGSTDCGFATFAGYGKIDEEIVWAKLTSLVEGAELAAQ